MDIKIRLAEREDLASIYQLVVELAVYEKEPEAVTASLKDYHQDFEDGIFEAIVAEKEGEVIGMMLYYMTYSTWKGRMLYLEDFVITQAFRRQGIGHLLFSFLKEIAKEKQARLIKWQVLDWNEPAIKFYQKHQCVFEKEWWNCKVFLNE